MKALRAGAVVACLILLLAACATLGPFPTEAGSPGRGNYYLVGAGPGDADLLTVRALEVIRSADLVFCDPSTKERLAAYVNFDGKQVLDGYGRLFAFYRQDCSQVKRELAPWELMSCEEYQRKQAEFARLVRQAVAAGKNVAMLNAGDPTIYGPSVWSLEEFEDLGPVVVPGLSAFNAANAALQARLGEVIITAPFPGSDHSDTLESLSVHGANMVIYMPRDMKEVLARLSRVYPAQAPVAIVSQAGCAGEQRVLTGTLGDISGKLGDLDVKLALLYVGKDVAGARPRPAQGPSSQGKFYLVGIGPGDADLATVRALEVIKQADVIFADERIRARFATFLAGKKLVDGYERIFPFYGQDCSQLSAEELAAWGPTSCEEYHRKQAEFAALVREAVAAGKTVALLDRGDPLLFGPEAWTLTEFGDLDTEVVPGLSCFNAANAALRAGVTNGKNSHSILLVSGRSVEEMAAHQASMVLFTMRTDFKKFIDALSKHYPPQTPVAIVLHAGYAAKETVMRGTLGTISAQVGEDKLPFEHLIYVGDFLAGSAEGGK